MWSFPSKIYLWVLLSTDEYFVVKTFTCHPCYLFCYTDVKSDYSVDGFVSGVTFVKLENVTILFYC